MVKNKLCLLIATIFMFTAGAQLSAQDGEKPKKKKLMIYDGENLKLQLYGYIKLDAVYNTANVVHESGPFRVANNYNFDFNTGTIIPVPIKNSASSRDGSFIMDPRQTRLGIKLSGPEILKAIPSAQVEVDFMGQTPGSGTGLRQGMVRMRHAYGKLDWNYEIGNTYLLIGQYWSLMTPIVAYADTMQFVSFGQAGLMFMREPQVTIGQKLGIKFFSILIEGGIVTVMAGNDTGGGVLPGNNNTQLADKGPGEASKAPGYRARVTLNTTPTDWLSVTLGGATHYQNEKAMIPFTNLWDAGAFTILFPANAATVFAATTNQIADTVESYSLSAFARIDVSLFTLVAAGFNGTNLDTFLCGLGQGAVEGFGSNQMLGVQSYGGYLQGQIDFRKIAPIPIKLNGGFGMETKMNRNFLREGSVLWNKVIQGNIWFFAGDYVKMGFEIAQHQTKYKRVLTVAKDMRYHGTFMLIF